jgi:4-hydroxybenzoate polyprenyltransferase
MILNDAFDAESDAEECPSRPIPSGVISKRNAFFVGFGCLLAALALAFLATFHAPSGGLQPVVVAAILSCLIVLYDGLVKRTWIASWTMGACRTFNILLGASCCSIAFTASQSKFINYPLLAYAVLVGLFVTGITFLGRAEHKQNQARKHLAIAGLVMAISLVGIGLLPWVPKLNEQFLTDSSRISQFYGMMVALVSLPVLRRTILAVRRATPAATGGAIVASLTSLIFLDAAVCFLALPEQPIYAASVALLIFPLMILRLFSAQT